MNMTGRTKLKNSKREKNYRVEIFIRAQSESLLGRAFLTPLPLRHNPVEAK